MASGKNKSKKTTVKKTQNIAGISIKVSIYAVLIAVLIILSAKGYKFGKDIFSEKGYDETPGTDVTITIDDGESSMSVAGELVKNGVVGDKLVFYIQSKLYGAKFIPGTYTVNSSESPEDIINKLSSEKIEE